MGRGLSATLLIAPDNSTFTHPKPRCQEKSWLADAATPNSKRKEVGPVRTPQNQSKHDSVVSIRAGQLRSEGNRVWADVDGYQRPAEVFGYIPDIVTNGQSDLLSEVETADSYTDDHTYNQLRAFDRAANYQLEVVVPESVYQAALNLYSNVWRISVDSWRTYR